MCTSPLSGMMNRSPYGMGGEGTNYNHSRAYSSDFSDFEGDNDLWYAGSPDKSVQSNYPRAPEPASASASASASARAYHITNERESMSYSGGFDFNDDDYSNELPLLEEIGIRFDHIWTKTQAVILLNKV